MVMSQGGSNTRDFSPFQPDKAQQKELLLFAKNTYERAQQAIRERMPAKILGLTRLLAEKNEYRDFFHAQEEQSKAKKAKIETKDGVAGAATSPAFDLAESEFALLKDEVLELIDMTSAVKLWLQLNVPRIEDGNNFGVGIQTDTISELNRVEDSALMTVENWSKFLLLRAKVIGKIHKHRELVDAHEPVRRAYEATLDSLDEKQLRSVWIGWLDLRNNFAILYDLFIKNIEKLLHPRSTNTSNMY